MVLLRKKEKDVMSFEKMKKIYENTGQKLEENMFYVYWNLDKLDGEVITMISVWTMLSLQEDQMIIGKT